MKEEKRILDTLGQIDDGFIEEAAPNKEQSRKSPWLKWGSLAACFVIIAVLGFGSLNKIINYSPHIEPTTEQTEKPTNQALPDGIGGEGNIMYDRAFDAKVYVVESELITLLTDKGYDWNAWIEERDKKGKKQRDNIHSPDNISSPEHTPLLLQVIKDFNIKREDFEKINDSKIAYLTGIGAEDDIEMSCFSKAEIDALYSGNGEEFVRAFATEYAIVRGTKAYAPRWYLNVSQSELAEAGITADEVAEKKQKLFEDREIFIGD